MREIKVVVVEALVVAALGLAFALAANALSPLGLRLTRNYFPVGHAPSLSTTPVSPHPAAGAPVDAVLARLQQHGLQVISSNEVIELFRDPRYEQGLLAVVDARDDKHYQAGHVPGAWQLDHYRPENYLPSVLPACMVAQKVVVYCRGGDCEDSEFAAVMLREAGVPRENLFVYPGGITEWMANGLPVETGARGSGQLLPSQP